MHLSSGYTVEPSTDKTTIVSDNGGHRFEFDPSVPMWIVHIIAAAHKAGMTAKSSYGVDEVLKDVADCGLTAAITTGPILRCYIYPAGVNPEQGRGWIGYADSSEGVLEAIADALVDAANRHRVV